MTLPRFKYGLLSLLIAVTVASLGMSWIAAAHRRAERQATAIATIRKSCGPVSCGRVFYEHELAKRPPPGPRLLRSLLGDDYFFRVTCVSAVEMRVDRVLECLENLPDVEELILRQTAFDPAKLAHIQALPNLRSLDLSFTNLNDAAMCNVKDLVNLRELNLDGTSIEGSGLAYLAEATNLEKLSLGGTEITDEGIKHLPKLHHLKFLNLTNTRVTGSGMRYLRPFDALETLSLGNRKKGLDADLRNLTAMTHMRALALVGRSVSDSDLDFLAGMNDLRELWVNSPLITDRGVVRLVRFRNLRKLLLRETAITNAAIAQLRASQIWRFWISVTPRSTVERCRHWQDLRHSKNYTSQRRVLTPLVPKC